MSLPLVEAARLIKVAAPTISEYEKGTRIPRTLKALQIEEITRGSVPVASWGKPPRGRTYKEDGVSI